MVSKKVEIRSLSYKEDAKAVLWTCDGSPEYSMEETEKAERGTDIVLYIDDENTEFLEKERIESLLKKYCRFLPIPVIFGKEQEWKDGKYVDTDKDKVVNKTAPIWMKKPSELKDEDYIGFYHELYPGQDDPLFWIHLNVDLPFTLTGILFFPKIKNNFEINKNRIQLYCNQVFVMDTVEGVVPDFLMLLQGVIDSPDIPLNVSRSYLQSDSSVKKIASYITKKVSSRLEDIFKNSRSDFEEKWDDIKIFIEYGMLTDEKFCESAMKFALLKDTEGKHFTFEEYKTLIQPEQTDKEGELIYLYATDKVGQYNYIKSAIDKGYNVLLMDGQLDSHFIQLMERKFEKSRFCRVDADVVENLIQKENKKDVNLSAMDRNTLTNVFTSQLPKVESANFIVTFEALGEAANPIIITQNEYMRRMKEMAAMQPGMSFYAEMPDSYNMIVNVEHPLVEKIRENALSTLNSQVQPLEDEISQKNGEIEGINSSVKDGETLNDEQRKQIKDLEDTVSAKRKELETVIADYAKTVPVIGQIIDLALLGNGLLRGEDLSKFISRSISLL